MLDKVKGAKLIVETCVRVKTGEKVLVVADDELFPMEMGRAIMDVAHSAGAEASMAIMKPAQIAGTEPPHAIAVAMKSVNIVIYVTNLVGVAHTNARKEATAAGVRVYPMMEVSEDYFKRDITVADIELIQKNTEGLAQKLMRASRARVTTPAGTDIAMSIEGRQALAIHPWGKVLAGLPDYGEAAIAPVEGTAEGTMVIDVSMIGWGYVLRQPIKCTVKSGKVVDISGGEDADKLRRIAATDGNASNIAELGLGTSHTIPRVVRGSRRDGGMAGNVHIALGRNNDIGGQTWSKIHIDGLMSHASVQLDSQVVIKDGVLQV